MDTNTAPDADNADKKRAMDARFDDVERMNQLIAEGRQRTLVGMAWNTLGNLQLELLKKNGLRPEHRVLDIGCGCLRAGVKLIPYLNEGHYYGIDSRLALLNAGFKRELKKADLEGKLARENLFSSAVYEHGRLDVGVIDFGLCISVMTHHGFNDLRVMLGNTAKFFTDSGVLFVSFYELPEGQAFSRPYTNMTRVRTFGHKPPFHYFRRDMEYAARGTGWTAHYLGEWGEPDGQALMRFERA